MGESEDIRLYRSLQRILASGRDLGPAPCLQAMLEALVAEVGANCAGVAYTVDETSTRTVVVASVPPPTGDESPHWELGDSPLVRALRGPNPSPDGADLGPRALVCIDEASTLPSGAGPISHRGFLGVALRDRYEWVRGGLSLGFAEPLSDERSRETTVALVEMLALKFQSVLLTLRDDLERDQLLVRLDAGPGAADLDIDPLVRLGNQRRFQSRLEAAADNHATTGRPFGLLLLDLDRFSSVNSALGHAVGDDLLRAVARCLVRRTRAATEQIFRLRDDRFAILCDNPRDVWGLRELGDRMVRSIRGVEATANMAIPATTACVGGAMADEPDASGAAVLAAAEAALDRAKRSGRDRACTHGID